MLKRLMNLSGVEAVAHFRETGDLMEAYGDLSEAEKVRLARLALAYKRAIQGHADQLAMFVKDPGWTPANGWIAHGDRRSVCGVSSIVAVVDNEQADLTEVMREMGREIFLT